MAVQLPGLNLTPMRGRGRELMEMMRRELSVPEGARWFEIRFALNEPVRVTVEYMPRSRSDASQESPAAGEPEVRDAG